MVKFVCRQSWRAIHGYTASNLNRLDMSKGWEFGTRLVRKVDYLEPLACINLPGDIAVNIDFVNAL